MMQMHFVNESPKKISKKLFEVLLGRLLIVEPNLSQKEVELLLTDNKTIQVLNRQYLQKDKATDVLSFPFNDPDHLGQIIISMERAEEQAKEIGQSLEEELKFLFAHGLLHLSGYDHENPGDEKIMLAKTYELLGRQ